MKRNILFVICIFVFSGCYPVAINTSYNDSLTRAESDSDAIFLSFADSKKANFYFILSSSNIKGKKFDIIKVRWMNPDRYSSQMNGLKTTLKFMIDNKKILTLFPIKKPVFVGYDVESKRSEEEIEFAITREDLQDIAFAQKTVIVEITGKNRVVSGRFNRSCTFRGFKHFINNT